MEKCADKIIDLFIAVCAMIWLFILKRYNLYSIADNLLGIIIRASASLTGCITVCGLIATVIRHISPSKQEIKSELQIDINIKQSDDVRSYTGLKGESSFNKLIVWLTWVGKHTLQIYLIHNLLLCLLPGGQGVDFSLISGQALIWINYLLTTILSCTLTYIFEKNCSVNKILWAK